MTLPFHTPDPSGTERAQKTKAFRDLATEVARLRPHAITRANGEESDHPPDEEDKHGYPANFTKGLLHDENGMVKHGVDYRCFVEAINSPDRTLFEKQVSSAKTLCVTFKCSITDQEAVKWRGWESPRSGHVYELEGPDAGAVAMAPAPKVGSSELAAEMAEVYAMAILRDVPFSEIAKGGKKRIGTPTSDSVLSSTQIVNALNKMPFFTLNGATSSTGQPGNGAHSPGLNQFEHNRRLARLPDPQTNKLTTESLFRGSTPGSMIGPYISQFMLAGTDSLHGTVGGRPGYPGVDSRFDAEGGYIRYGNQIIDQRVHVHRCGVDYMSSWNAWLDVQNGADMGSANLFETKRRFITTPRDLATYVHFDALYQAYLNAGLILLALETPTSRGFPEPSPSGHRRAFATFGGPHILSLVTEVATRCLKAVRRQKFNYHRRARPETLGGRLVMASAGKHGDTLGAAADVFKCTLDEIPEGIRKAIVQHNLAQKEVDRTISCPEPGYPDALKTEKMFDKHNLLLPMAFAEGSPMHPAYGAGHATVAGGCVTMLKAFFEMYDPGNIDKDNPHAYHNGRRILKIGQSDYFVPNTKGDKLVNTKG
ncbi:MAG: hypothetical protein AB8B63_02950, partial [Granulosicoccus sp.]